PAEERSAALLTGEVDHPGALAHVDRIDLAQKRQRLVSAQLTGPRPEGADVLRQAAAAEAQPGMEESTADSVVIGECMSELRDVSAGRLAHLGYRVDEGDLGGKEGIGRRFDQLGGGEVGDQEGYAGLQQRPVDLAEHLLCAPGCDPHDDTV